MSIESLEVENKPLILAQSVDARGRRVESKSISASLVVSRSSESPISITLIRIRWTLKLLSLRGCINRADLEKKEEKSIRSKWAQEDRRKRR